MIQCHSDTLSLISPTRSKTSGEEKEEATPRRFGYTTAKDSLTSSEKQERRRIGKLSGKSVEDERRTGTRELFFIK